jgi:SNF2 family DNA or RNA helicase
VLGGWHRDVYEIWNRLLAHYNPVMFTGSESPREKDRSVARFVDGDSRIFIISLRAGRGLDGLQYTSCRDVVSGELDWSPTVHKQLIGRVRRPGVSSRVNAHYPWVNGGSDPLLMDMNGRKSDQSRGLIDPGLAPAARFTDDSRIKALARLVLEQE